MAKSPYWMKRRDLVKQMHQLGVPTNVARTDLRGSNSPSMIRIDAVGGVSETSAFDLDPGGTGYMASLSLTVLREPFAIAAFDLELPWMRTPVIWLSDPADGDGPHNTYQFPGRHLREFPKDIAINHFANAQRNLPLGKCIEGLLLGYGFDSIPSCFQHGGHVGGMLSIVDQFGEEHSAEISFWIDRSARLSPRKSTGSPRKSLFERPVRSSES
jgi:hypothetical protein